MAAPPKPRRRFLFAGFAVSPARRTLLREGREIPLIPRYFDLLVLLLERRHEAVHRRDILDAVWNDVVVSDGALSQAVRTLRRALGDDPREPAFIRTVSRHGYRFVHPEVVEEAEDSESVSAPQAPDPGKAGAGPAGGADLVSAGSGMEAGRASQRSGGSAAVVSGSRAGADPLEAALEKLLSPEGVSFEDRDAARREAAETLHLLGTAEALRRLERRPGHEMARAILRDSRWDVPGAGEVPLIGGPGAPSAIVALIALRLRRAARLAGSRWGSASGGGAAAGLLAGAVGGMLLQIAPGSTAPLSVPVAMALVGLVIGGLGAAGVGAGLAAAEAVVRSYRGAALVVCGALGGGLIGAVAHLLGRLALEGIFGHDLSPVGGGLEGLGIGGAAGIGYALSTPRPEGGGLAAPRGVERIRAAAVTGACCAAAGVALAWAGRNLGGTSLDFMAHSFPGSRVGLAPLARLLGERDLGPLTRIVIGACEGLLFGFGLALGLTRRPRTPEE